MARKVFKLGGPSDVGLDQALGLKMQLLSAGARGGRNGAECRPSPAGLLATSSSNFHVAVLLRVSEYHQYSTRDDIFV